MGARELLDGLTGIGFSVSVEGDRLIIRPWSKLPADKREALRLAKSELLALFAQSASESEGLNISAVAWTHADIEHFLSRRARLLRWGWSEAKAEALAERLVLRDRRKSNGDPASGMRGSTTSQHNKGPQTCQMISENLETKDHGWTRQR